MDLELWRYSGGVTATLGFLMERGPETWENLCFTLEDQFQKSKKSGETRIPPGRYEIKLRTEGGMHPRYALRYPDIHQGMLWLQDVPGFEWIYLHIGNDDDDTAGCILVGEDRSERARNLYSSAHAYKRIYPRIAHAIASGGGCFITVVNLDRYMLPRPQA